MSSEFGNFSGKYQQYSKKGDNKPRGAKVTIEKFPSFESSRYGQTNQVQQERVNYPVENLISLYTDIKRYKEEFQRQFEKSLRGKLIGEQNFAAKMKEMNELISEIEAFAKTKNITLDEKSIRVSSAANEEREAIERLNRAVAVRQKETADKDAIYLSQEISAERTQLIIKRLDVIASKMRALEMLIGNQEMFKLKSLCATFQEELTNLNFLDPAVAGDIIRKVEIVAENINKEAQERRPNFFSSQQKEQLTKFFEEFADVYQEYQNGVETNHVLSAVEVVESNQEILNSACLFLKEIKNLSESLETILQDAKENQATLKELDSQMAGNCTLIEENLKALGKH